MFSFSVQKSSTFSHVTPSKKVINQVKVLGLKLIRYTHIHAYDLILGTELVPVRVM